MTKYHPQATGAHKCVSRSVKSFPQALDWNSQRLPWYQNNPPVLLLTLPTTFPQLMANPSNQPLGLNALESPLTPLLSHHTSHLPRYPGGSIPRYIQNQSASLAHACHQRPSRGSWHSLPACPCTPALLLLTHFLSMEARQSPSNVSRSCRSAQSPSMAKVTTVPYKTPHHPSLSSTSGLFSYCH